VLTLSGYCLLLNEFSRYRVQLGNACREALLRDVDSVKQSLKHALPCWTW